MNSRGSNRIQLGTVLQQSIAELFQIRGIPFHLLAVGVILVTFVALASLQTPDGPIGIPTTHTPTTLAPTYAPTSAPA